MFTERRVGWITHWGDAVGYYEKKSLDTAPTSQKLWYNTGWQSTGVKTSVREKIFPKILSKPLTKRGEVVYIIIRD